MTNRKPLNGEKTHPLKEASLRVLDLLQREGPQPRHEINPGVIDRLSRENLIELCVEEPVGRNPMRYVRLTDAGHARIDEERDH